MQNHQEFQSPLTVESLKKSYGKVDAVRGVSFDIKKGEIFGLLGPNGAGKTSIISIITSLEKPTSGSVRVFGTDVLNQDPLIKSRIGFVPQEIVTHGFFTVEEVLEFISGYYGLKNNKKRIDELLKRLGLWEHREKKIPQLSGGMKRRFLIAKALVHSPDILLLDEPTAGVDIELRESLWKFVRELNQQDGVSILLTTHYLEEAEELCNRVGILNLGELKKIGPTRELVKELTLRRVRLTLRKEFQPGDNPYVLEHTQTEIVCQIPYKMGVGDLMTSLKIEPSYIQDIEIHEGDLEEVFVQVVGGGHV
ncbi:MAG: ABC transporter ATP-binding protein [Bdellovibrionales bacterium]|nr:ABC transporter ATP-binding protein [Bdellovibrionales bacterium]